MRYLARVISALGGRRIVVALGMLYVVLAAGWPFLSSGHESLGDILIMAILIGAPGLTLLYVGYRLPDLEIRPELYRVIAGWCLGSIGVLLGMLLLYELQPTDSLDNVGESVLILTAFAAVAGLGIGVQDARAKTRACDAEEYARELERYETAVETVEDGIYIVGPNETFSMVSSSFADLVGYDVEELIGRSPSILYDEGTKAEAMQLQREILDGERTSATVEHPLQTGDGNTFPVETRFVIRRTPEGDHERIGVVRDITERKERERELEVQNERLDSFARVLAHELRNPVNVGQIYVQQLSGEAGSEALAYVTEAFDRIEDMIDLMLMVARGREAVGEPTTVRLADVAREAWDDVECLDAKIEVAIDHTIQADETYIRHLFRNLFENAIEHGGTDVTVTVGELPTGFYVADDGSGISSGEHNDVFEMGYSSTDSDGGMGLGLAFVHEVADAYGWNCVATESAAGGAQFEFQNVTTTHAVSE